MRYEKGDIWEAAAATEGFVVVPTNTKLKKNGEAVMGAGLAKAAANLIFPLPKMLGEHIRVWDEKPFPFEWKRNWGEEPIRRVICMPTKTDWRQPSDLALIERGCKELVWMSYLLDNAGATPRRIYLPRLGCGLGGLDWEREVRPIVDAHLEGDQFVLVEQP